MVFDCKLLHQKSCFQGKQLIFEKKKTCFQGQQFAIEKDVSMGNYFQFDLQSKTQ